MTFKMQTNEQQCLQRSPHCVFFYSHLHLLAAILFLALFLSTLRASLVSRLKAGNWPGL